jgi:hypothetical protein
VQNLVGGANDDWFQIFAAGSVSGHINGGGASSANGNTLNYSTDTGATVTVNLGTHIATGIGSFANIEAVKGQNSTNADILIGPNATTNWKVTGANSGTINSVSFVRVGNLTGGTGTNIFTIGVAGSLTGIITGGAGANTLVGPSLVDTFNITGMNAGTLTDSKGVVHFTSIENLTGGSVTNYFVFGAGQGVTGTITGHGISRLDYSAYSSAVYVNLLSGVATGTGGITNIKQVFGGGQGDVLVGNGPGVLLQETSGRNSIIGGTAGLATLNSGSGQDIVIAGSTTHDNNQTALQAIESYWSTNGGTFAQRAAALSSGVDGYTFKASTVKHHAGSGDTIALGSANDWLFWRMGGAGADTLTGTPGKSTFL